MIELKWQENGQALVKLFKDHSRAKEGYLNQDGFLNESDFLGGILAVSPLTPHKLEAPSGQLRMQFIFLYYDANRNGRLEVEEIAKMIEHIQQLRGQPHSDAMVDATALTSLYSGPFGFAAFYDAAQKRMLNGTSPLLRTQHDLAEAIRKADGQPGAGLPPALSQAPPSGPGRPTSQVSPMESTSPAGGH